MVCATSGRTVIDDETVYDTPDGEMEDDAVDENQLMYVIRCSGRRRVDGAVDEDQLMYVIPDGAVVDELV